MVSSVTSIVPVLFTINNIRSIRLPGIRGYLKKNVFFFLIRNFSISSIPGKRLSFEVVEQSKIDWVVSCTNKYNVFV